MPRSCCMLPDPVRSACVVSNMIRSLLRKPVTGLAMMLLIITMRVLPVAGCCLSSCRSQRSVSSAVSRNCNADRRVFSWAAPAGDPRASSSLATPSSIKWLTAANEVPPPVQYQQLSHMYQMADHSQWRSTTAASSLATPSPIK